MPVIRLNPQRLLQLVDPSMTLEELGDLLFRLKCEVEPLETGEIEVEVNADRPDMLVSEGIARAAKGLLGKEKGIPSYRVVDTDYVLVVEKAPTRPYIALAVAYGVNVDEEYLTELVQFQEKLHTTVGRKRRKIAIGLHDLDKTPGKTIVYREAPLDTMFTPLHVGRRMSIREALKETPQGREYGSISLSPSGHPAIFAGSELISLPPVINSDITRLEPGTKNLLIDVTGTDLETVLATMDIIASNLAERGATIGRVRVEGLEEASYTPVLRTEKMVLDTDFASRWLGFRVTPSEAAEHLERMRLGARVLDEARVEAVIPPYRIDVLHPVDLVEDIAISIGYDRIEPKPLELRTRSKPLPRWRLADAARDLMVGMGFQEVLTFMLANPGDLERMRLAEDQILLENPITAELGGLRRLLLQQLLRLAAENQHVDMPLKVFEVGDVVAPDPGEETGARTEFHVAALVMSPRTGYEEVQAYLYALLRNLGVGFRIMEAEHPTFMEGRVARVVFEGGEGFVGEIHPEVLENFGIKYPAAGFEVDITGLASGAAPVARR